MRGALASMRDSYGQPEQWCLHEISFHDYVVHAARNAVMSTIMEMLSRMLIESRRETVRMLTDYETSYRAHANVFLQIEKQDADGAAQAMLDHFRMMQARAAQAYPAREST